ncbi:MAG TPA: hypothetical protein VGR81_06385 [Candidatus Acidoferrales bacterium]|nr:hypothetical protein [Candidatus Acidoferrales bacterium]
MVLAVALMLFQFPGSTVAPRASQTPSTAISTTASNNSAPATPGVAHAASVANASPKPVPDGGRQLSKSPASLTTSSAAAQPDSAATAALYDYYLPPPPAFRPKQEPTVIPNERAWLFLGAAEHSAAGFDAWSTRRAISQGRIETDPLMRPFANSNAIYAAIQVVPFGLDYVARRMEHSSGWTRHVWWVPQSLATATFLLSGSYNTAHTH